MRATPFWLVFVVGLAWAASALWVQFPDAPWILALLAVAALGVLWARLVKGWGWAALAAVAVVVGLWYSTLTPRLDRDWAEDVAHIMTADVAGDAVTLHNVRAFRWQDDTNAIQSWETRSYDLSKLTGADVITSSWSSPAIAHLLVSFGFSDGQRVVFSVEIRKEKGESFSSIGGFFRQFELALIAADEEDVIKLRTNYRDEDVHLYPVNLPPEALRTMFLQYVDLGNRIATEPEFYNTITANCTSVVWGLTHALKADVPWDRSLVFSGYLPEFMMRMNILQGPGTLNDIIQRAAISAKAKALPEGADFSAGIRAR
nr:DUF4105 domain-containing protein [Fuscibacter oryzae]